MNPGESPAPPRERVGYPRVLFGLGALVCLSAGLSALLGAGKGWDERDLAALDAPRSSSALPEEEPERVRPPATAGQFFPADPGELRAAVDRMLASAPARGLRGVRAILVPHAGYVFSGEIAAAAFREVEPGFRRVFLLAANHDGEADYYGASILDVTHYGMPGAKIPLSSLVAELRKEGLVACEPRAHRMHMIEIELPFLQAKKGWPAEPDYSIVPMIVSRLDAGAIGELVRILQRHADPETLFVFSVDLSHFYPDAQARRLDQYTIDAVMGRDRAALERAVTDGNHVLQALVDLARLEGWEATFLGARNSGAVSGAMDRVVGYAAVAFHEPFRLTEEERTELLLLARRSIEEGIREGEARPPEPGWIDRHPIFRIPRGVFVTLEKGGELRGCTGEITSTRPLWEGVQRNAIEAALHDSRFPPVAAEELAEITLAISILTYPERIAVDSPDQVLDVLKPGRDGVILVHKGRRSIFLPQVWEELPDPAEFLAHLAVKQGASPDAWRSPDAVLYRCQAYRFGEAEGGQR
ncbi:MAG: AmmeMemoRadiSam system protein A [Planctomycetota bacterium]